MKKSSPDIMTLNGNSLSFRDIVAIGIGDKKVALAPAALEKCAASRNFLEKEIASRKIIYGVNTSFGPMCNKIIPEKQIRILQANLIRSHAAGLGDPLKPYVARGVMAVRLNTLLKGYSGVRIELLELLRDIINVDIAPYIPESGSVGASGDLIHLSHMALALIGEGNVYFQNKLVSASAALKKAGLRPIALSYKEGLALINGTSAMTSIAAFALFGAVKLFNIACAGAAFSMEIFSGIDDAFDPDLHKIKPHPGQIKTAALIASLFKYSHNIKCRKYMHEAIRSGQKSEESVFETDINVQDVYSIRCAPQVLAPVLESIEYAEKTVNDEANSSNDNPLIIPEKKKIIHGGNFHGQSIAFAMDSLAMAVSVLSNLSERRINKLLDRKLNEGLPEHLIPGTPGLTMGFMGAQYLATSTAAENRCLANPVNVHSISCNASNQDVVSMGTVAARKAFKIVSNAKHILTLEILADMQALHFRNASGLGRGTSAIYRKLLPEFKVYDNSFIFHEQLLRFRKLLFSSQLFDDLKIYIK